MRNIDYSYGDMLIEDSISEQFRIDELMSKEKEIKTFCDLLLTENTVESISKLMLLAFEHSDGVFVMDRTDWGRTVKFALNILKEEPQKEESLIFKTQNLAQLVYVFEIIRHLNYRVQIANDNLAKEELELIYSQFNVSEMAKKKFFEATKM